MHVFIFNLKKFVSVRFLHLKTRIRKHSLLKVTLPNFHFELWCEQKHKSLPLYFLHPHKISQFRNNVYCMLHLTNIFIIMVEKS